MPRGLYEEAKKAGAEIPGDFRTRDNYFLELQDHGIPDAADGEPAAAPPVPERLGIPLVATNDVPLYHMRRTAEAHDILLCIQTGKKLADENRMRYEGGQYYVKSEEEMRALFPYAPRPLDNTHKIAERCQRGDRVRRHKAAATMRCRRAMIPGDT